MTKITPLFDQLKASHSAIYRGDDVFPGTYNGPSEADFSEQWILKYVTNL